MNKTVKKSFNSSLYLAILFIVIVHEYVVSIYIDTLFLVRNSLDFAQQFIQNVYDKQIYYKLKAMKVF